MLKNTLKMEKITMLPTKLKICWVSAGPSARTGYGFQTESIVSGLIEKGYDITCIAGGGSFQWSGDTTHPVKLANGNTVQIPVLPTWLDQSGIQQWPEYQAKYGFNLIVTLWDYFAIEPYTRLHFPAIHYIPVDAPFTNVMYQSFKDAYHVLAMSEYGYFELLKWFTPDRVSYIPHSINTTAYQPHPLEKAQLKQQLGLPEDCFLLLHVGANVGERKELPVMLHAFKQFLKTHPDAYLYLLTNFTVGFPSGYNIGALIQDLGIGQNVILPAFDTMRHPASIEQMVKLYSTADVYWSTSMGEGFGVPLIESQACGTPVLAIKNSTSPELTDNGRTGWLVEPLPREQSVNVPVWIPSLQHYPIVNMQKIVSTLNDIYENKKERQTKGTLAQQYVSQNYNWEKIIHQWQSLLNRVREEVTLHEQIRQNFTVKQPSSTLPSS